MNMGFPSSSSSSSILNPNIGFSCSSPVTSNSFPCDTVSSSSSGSSGYASTSQPVRDGEEGEDATPHSSMERLPPPPAALLPPIEKVSSVSSKHTSFPRPQQSSAFDLGPADPQTASYNQATLKSDKSC